MKKTKTPPPQAFKMVKRAKINNVKLYLRKYCMRADPNIVFFYEAKASDGSYFKTPSEDAAQLRFEQLKAFEQRQLTIQ